MSLLRPTNHALYGVNDADDQWRRRTISRHMHLLGHHGLGVTELRVVEPAPRVAYSDSEEETVRLCLQMDGKVSGVYVGRDPRPVHLFDLAPNRWVRARGGAEGNCAHDRDIEYITTVFFDIDVVSPQRQKGHPASQAELKQTLQAAQQLIRQDGLALESVIGCSGNGHYVIVPIAPIAIDGDEVAARFRRASHLLAESVASRYPGVRIDPVYNLSRVMRVMGTWNRKGRPLPDRPHRRAFFVTEPIYRQSMTLHHMIINAGASLCADETRPLPVGLKCDLDRIEECEFIKWCRRHASEVSEPSWFAMLSNLAWLQGGVALAHEISAIDPVRYDRANTHRVIERIIREGYKPINCRTIMDQAMICPGRGLFRCSRIGGCRAKAPMYMAALQAEP